MPYAYTVAGQNSKGISNQSTSHLWVAASRRHCLATNLPMATQTWGVTVSYRKEFMAQSVIRRGSVISESCPCKSRLAPAAISTQQHQWCQRCGRHKSCVHICAVDKTSNRSLEKIISIRLCVKLRIACKWNARKSLSSILLRSCKKSSVFPAHTPSGLSEKTKNTKNTATGLF